MFNLKMAETRAMLGAPPSRKADHAPRSKTMVFDRRIAPLGLRIDGGDER